MNSLKDHPFPDPKLFGPSDRLLVMHRNSASKTVYDVFEPDGEDWVFHYANGRSQRLTNSNPQGLFMWMIIKDPFTQEPEKKNAYDGPKLSEVVAKETAEAYKREFAKDEVASQQLTVTNKESYAVLVTGFKTEEEAMKWRSAYEGGAEQSMYEYAHLDDNGGCLFPSNTDMWKYHSNQPTPITVSYKEKDIEQPIQLTVIELALQRYDK
jgi:hypothetical protein